MAGPANRLEGRHTARALVNFLGTQVKFLNILKDMVLGVSVPFPSPGHISQAQNTGNFQPTGRSI